jgi:hypothetical protein
MAITNGYLTADEALAYLRLADQLDRTLVESWVETASRAIDRYTGRQFYADSVATARLYAPEYGDLVAVDDISTTTGLIVKTDDDDDGTFERTWTAAEYQTEPLNALAVSEPICQLRATGRGSGPVWPVSARNALVQVTAKWGWPAVPAAVKQASYLQLGRLALRRQSPGGVLVSPDLGTSDRLYAQLDPDARVLLDPFRRGELLP